MSIKLNPTEVKAQLFKKVTDNKIVEGIWLPSLRVGLTYPKLDGMFHGDPVSSAHVTKEFVLSVTFFARIASHGFGDHRNNCDCENIRRHIRKLISEAVR